MHALWMIPGLVLLTAGAEFLVRGASDLARAVGMPSLIIGLTVVAYGTSAPELAVSANAAWQGDADIALGNVVGSNIFNVLFILGLSSIILPLAVSSQVVRLDVPIMIGVSVLAVVFCLDGKVARLEGLMLLMLMVAYTLLLIVLGKRQTGALQASQQQAQPENADQDAAQVKRPAKLLVCVVLVLIGLGMLVLGSHWLVGGAVTLAKAMGVSDLMIGLTLVAAGTSLPEVATSVLAAIRGERDLAVGNVVGSNLFNLMGVLGSTAVIASDGVAVVESALWFDLPIMLAVAVVCLPIFFTGGRIARSEGALLLGFYVSYIVALYFIATEHPAFNQMRLVMFAFVIPLTVLGLLVSIWQHVRLARRTAVQ